MSVGLSIVVDAMTVTRNETDRIADKPAGHRLPDRDACVPAATSSRRTDQHGTGR